MNDPVIDLRLSKHAVTRLRQRGYRASDVELVLAYGTECDEATILTDVAAAAAVREMKRTIQRIERLRGTAVIVAEDVVASVYRPDREKLRRLLRSARREPRGQGGDGVLPPSRRGVGCSRRRAGLVIADGHRPPSTVQWSAGGDAPSATLRTVA